MAATFTRLIRDMLDDGWQPPLSEYPIFDPEYREPLNTKILNHFMMREIGYETAELFSFGLKIKLNEVMPYYNKMYESEKLTFNPLSTMSYSEVLASDQTGATAAHEVTDSTNTSDADNTADSKSRAVESATPQTRLQGDMDYANGLNDVTSASSTTAHGTGVANQVQNVDGTTTMHNASDRTLSGYSGVVSSKLITAYRAQLLNIDMMVINELESEFMSIWSNGDSYTDVMMPGLPMFGMNSFPYYF